MFVIITFLAALTQACPSFGIHNSLYYLKVDVAIVSLAFWSLLKKSRNHIFIIFNFRLISATIVELTFL